MFGRKETYLGLFFLLVIVTSQVPQKRPFGLTIDGNRIIGGGEAPLHAHPYMARVITEWVVGDPMMGLCGGTLINSQYVLTAGHCVYNRDKKQYWQNVYIFLGSHYLNQQESSSVTIKASDVTINQDYIDNGMHDVALVQLSSPAPSSSFIQTACLSPAGSNYMGQEALAMGWGLTATNGSPSPVLKQTEVPIVNTCVGQGNFDPSTMICTGFNGVVGQDTVFKGDSGGPLVIEDNQGDETVIGVASYVTLQQTFPWRPAVVTSAVFTKVSSQLSWITSIVGDSNICISQDY